MPKTLPWFSELPYGEHIPRLLREIIEALDEYVKTDTYPSRQFSLPEKPLRYQAEDRAIKDHPGLGPGVNLESVLTSHRAAADDTTWPAGRLSRLIHFHLNAANAARDPGDEAVFIPSPFAILHDFLTVPGEPASQAYAETSLEYFLFALYGVAPQGIAPDNFEAITYRDIVDFLDGLRNRPQFYNINVDSSIEVKKFNFFIAFLSLKNYIVFRSTGDQVENAFKAFKDTLDGRQSDATSPFRIVRAPGIAELPMPDTLANRFWGLSIPIRGADTILAGGLRFSARPDQGLVAHLSGGPGTGKTSFAVSLAASLAPLNTTTFYLSSDESSDDLVSRLQTITPDFILKNNLRSWRNLAHQGNSNEMSSPSWFRVETLSHDKDSLTDIQDSMQQLRSSISAQNEDATSSHFISLRCPLLVIIDGANFPIDRANENNVEQLRSFVETCRELGGLVLLLTTTSRPESLEYLVDLDLDFYYRDTVEPDRKPIRTLSLLKTRYQISRPGGHVFHLSGPDGFRIVPQIPSELDKRSLRHVRNIDPHIYTEVLDRVFPTRSSAVDGAKIPAWPTSRGNDDKPLSLHEFGQILLHGRGARGKAQLALKILLAPRFQVEMSGANMLGLPWREPRANRILIVSFLYPRDYYESVLEKITNLFESEYPGSETNLGVNAIQVMHCTPGYLGPDDLFNKISRALDAAELEGVPFTGVLLDGIHNVFLQFPRLEKSDMFWPAIFSHLRTRNVNVVVTHTIFDVPGITENDEELNVQKSRPMLHVLVQSCDYFINVRDVTVDDISYMSDEFDYHYNESGSDVQRERWLTAEACQYSVLEPRVAAYQKPRFEHYRLWDRESGKIYSWWPGEFE